MKQRILVCFALALLLALGLCTTAMAANVPEVNMVLSENRFSGPKEITVTISVTNTADTNMPGPMALYDPAGNRIDEFGTPTLAAGATKSWTGTWTVTEEQLAIGRIGYTLVYTMADDTGVLITKKAPFYKEIVNLGLEPEVQVKRTITPTTARQNQNVSVIYEINNVGGVDVTDVTIKESSAVSSTSGTIPVVKAGEKATYTFTVAMKKKNITSRAAVTYQAGGKSYTTEVGDATIKYGDVKLEASLKADKKGGMIGETMKLTLTLKNTGKVAYQNVTVTDAILGTVFTGLSAEAGKTVTYEKELTITETCDFQFIVSGTTPSGDTVETATDRLHVIAADPARQVSLEVNAQADSSTIYMLPGIVKFTVTVSNVGTVDAADVKVVSSGVTLKEYEVIPAGQSKSFVRDVRVSIPGTFRFDAVTANELGTALTFEGNGVRILHSRPTATPSQVPITTPARPSLMPDPTTDDLPVDWKDTAKPVMEIAMLVMLGLGGVCLVLVIIGVAARTMKAAKSSQAADHLERDGYSVYTQAVSSSKRRILPDSDQDEDPSADSDGYMATEPTDVPAPVMEEATPVESDMQEAMNELYPDAGQQEAAPAPAEESIPVEAPAEAPVAPVTEIPAEEVTYRRRRRTTADE